jgi:hypothetical protein
MEPNELEPTVLNEEVTAEDTEEVEVTLNVNGEATPATFIAEEDQKA